MIANPQVDRAKPQFIRFIEAPAGRNEAAGHAQRVDRTMLLDRSHASPVGFDAARDLDLPRRTAGLDVEGDGRERDHDALDQRRTGTAERRWLI